MPDFPCAIDIAGHAGIDLALTDDNLRLSYEQRALQHQAALDLALTLELPDNSFVSDLQELLQRLDDAGIDFVLVGGYAAMHRRGIARDGSNPTPLAAFGAYGINIEPGIFGRLVASVASAAIRQSCQPSVCRADRAIAKACAQRATLLRCGRS